jgi:chaperonin GroES
MKFRPLYDRVVVKHEKPKNVTRGGIVIPNTNVKQSQGTVLAVGSGKLLEDGTIFPLSVAVDDTVIFSEGSGLEIEVDGEKFIVLKEYEIHGVIKQK